MAYDFQPCRVRVQLVRERDDSLPKGPIRSAEPVVAYLRERGAHLEAQEVFYVFVLDTKNRVSLFREVSRGTADTALVHPTLIFGLAYLGGGAAVIVAHNHPSGDPTPSPEDRAITRQLAEAGRVLGIPLLDHIVVAEYGFESLVDEIALV